LVHHLVDQDDRHLLAHAMANSGANLTTMIYNASNSLACFSNYNLFFPTLKTF
jgi:hypothetical protein